MFFNSMKEELQHIELGMNTLDDNIFVLLHNLHRRYTVELILLEDKHDDDNEYGRVNYLMDIDLNKIHLK